MTTLYGLIGEKLGHSLSSIIHKKLFKLLNMDSDYKLFEINKPDLKANFIKLKNEGIQGLNVTIPYKVDVMDFLDDISNEAKSIGAVNTVCFENHKIIGHNTDYFGFARMLDKNSIKIKDKVVVILGAGGAAKAVIQYISNTSAKRTILVSRDPSKVSKNFKNVEFMNYNQLNDLDCGDVVINCTPVGMYPNVNNSPISEDCISKFSVAVDLIYNPSETKFLKLARENKLQSVNGLYMLVAQAISAEELWNHIKIDDKIIDEIYKDLIRDTNS
ncbi:shikimate dehydrogenase [Clostridium acidisoli DSM 12555]|uniref:Shikimate dehydrogenase (NADP(+)) n=1 Tax=Clostridium acidisoli DSM 12555 TaxID=1121291 RepID=A0A1W1XUM2_9CLOT|nr:shikimate dehydrogenase [Clostridium acidisoli]SMC27555.1 shikimate dehydrogenase [Clostridium acidisoli DSM 12555]